MIFYECDKYRKQLGIIVNYQDNKLVCIDYLKVTLVGFTLKYIKNNKGE